MTPRILYVETYNSGSHARVLDILRSCSSHTIDAVTLPPNHWRWRYIAGHHDVADAIARMRIERPDGLILSGPLNVPALLQHLPRAWGHVPTAVYFHESQWTYPFPPQDTRPYLVGHLDAVAVADHVWFNSRFHRDAFRDAALNHMSPRMRSLARQVISKNWGKARIVYPPVKLQSHHNRRTGRGEPPRLLWAARWEREKRPDRFVAAVERLRDLGRDVEVAILGAGKGILSDPEFLRIADLVTVSGAIAERDAYEATVASCDIVVSTTDHEFFGIAMIEAALNGVLPVLPNAHAYPETLPGAFFYPNGDIDALVRILARLIDTGWGRHRPWQSDAARFLPHHTVAAFDRVCDELVRSARTTSR